MKMLLKYLGLAFIPAFVTISCEKSEMISEDEPQPEKIYRTITLQFPEDSDTKVSLASDGKTAWEEGDKIFIHGSHVGSLTVSEEEHVCSRVVTLSAENISLDGKTATFTFEDISAKPTGWRSSGYKATMFAAYPADAVKGFSNGDTWYYSSAFTDTNNLLLAGCNDTTVNDGNTFQFKNLSGALSFVVSGDFDSYVFSGKAGTEVVGYDVFSVRVDAESSFGDKYYVPYNGGSGGIASSGPQYKLTGSVKADGSTVNYIYFPAGVNLSSGFIIKFKKGGEIVKTLSTSTAKNIEAGKYLALGDVTTHLVDYVPPVNNATSPAIAGATDLSATASANCYMVNAGDASNAGKVFKFKAYKGKSTINAGTISSVEILWETQNSTSAFDANSVIAAVDFDKQASNSYYEICFQMPATLHAGNALIAAKDADGIILWSWHIWVPSSSVNDITDSDFVNASSGKIMDRNLGALEPAVASESVVPTTAFGLYYQWGRKDPFITSNWTRYATVAFSTSSTWVTTDTSVQHPTVFYRKKDDSTSPATCNWNSSEITTLWEDSGKTIYDPCPPEYRVDKYNDTKRFWKYTDTSNWEANTTYGWLKYGSSIVFPLSGYTENLSSYKVKERTVQWSATYKDKERGYGLYTSPSPSYHSYYKYVGAAIRCVKE